MKNHVIILGDFFKLFPVVGTMWQNLFWRFKDISKLTLANDLSFVDYLFYLKKGKNSIFRRNEDLTEDELKLARTNFGK